MRRAAAAGGITLLAGAGVSLLGWFHAGVGIALLAVAAFWALLLVPAVNNRLPRLRLERGGRTDGFAIRVVPPPGPAREQLRGETLRLADDMRTFIDAEWSRFRGADHNEWHALVQASIHEPDEAARSAIWQDYINHRNVRADRERQELERQFGGRLRYVVDQFERRGMLTGRESRRIAWDASHVSALSDAATALEALAQRL